MAVLVLYTALAYAQKISVDVQNQPINELFKIIESKTDYKILCNTAETDSLTVSVKADNEEPLKIIQQAIKNTSFKAFGFEKNIYILRDKNIFVALPENFRNDTESGTDNKPISQEHREQQDSIRLANIQEITQKDNRQTASADNRVYRIGKPTDPKKNMVSLSGYVYDIKTGEPIPGVPVLVDNTNYSAVSDSYGYYSLQLPSGNQTLNIEGVGIKGVKRQLLLYSDGNLDIRVEEKIYTLKEVEIASDRTDKVKQIALGIERLEMKEIKNIPTAFGEADIMRIVMSLPGVKSVGEVSSGFNVRGGATDQNLILFNDNTLYNPTHLFGIFSAFNPDVVRDMELYKSSIPAKYGGRISSVLDIRNKEGSKNKYSGSMSLGLLTSRFNVEGPIVKEKSSFLVGVRTTYSDWLLKQLPKKSGYQDGTANFYDFNLSANHAFNNKNSIYINGYYSNDKFRFQNPEKYSYQNANASLKWRSILKQNFTSVFSVGYDHYKYNTENVENTAAAYKLDFAIDQGFAKADFSWYPTNDHVVNFGLNTLYYLLSPGTYKPYNNESIVKENIMQKEKALESALYISDQWDITPEFSIDAGIRYSIFNVMGPRSYYEYDSQYLPSLETKTDSIYKDGGVLKTYHGPEFRLSMRYSFGDNWAIKAGVNSMRQYIHKISNTTIMAPTDTWKLSDMNIKPQSGVQYAVGIYKKLWNNTVDASIEAYYKTMKDYLDYRAGAQLLMNHHLETDVLNTDGRAYGVEFMLRKTLGKLNGWISYTYSKTELRQNDKRISIPVNKGDWYPADFDKPHEVKLVGNYRFTHRYSTSFNLDYSTGRPITVPISKYSSAGGQYVYYSDRNTYRIPDYFRVDWSFNIEPSHHLTLIAHSMISIGVYNLTGRKNAYSVFYKQEDGQIKGYKLSIFGNPIPYISYNIKF